MSTFSRTALPLPQLPTWFSAIAASFLMAGRPEGWEAKPRVLLIEDERAICELLSLYLGEQGLEVATVRSAAEARAIVARGQFRLVILDWVLEGVERLDLLQLCKARHPDIPIIVLSGADLDKPRIKAVLAQGADAVVRKQGPLDALSTAICRSLDRRQVEPLNAA